MKTPILSTTVAVMVKKTSSLGTLLIKPVDKQTAKHLIVEHHYSHKWNDGGFGVYNFGIYRIEDPDNCLGVAVYGYMKQPKAKIFSHPNPQAWMCELNRLWISDELGKNAETVMISCSIKLLHKIDPNVVAVQSFADGRLGCGTIYKAANFRYYGFHFTKFLRHRRTGEISHHQNFTNTQQRGCYLRNNIAYLLHDFDVFQVKTYRYIYPLCPKFVFTKGREQPYPAYEKGELPCEWVRDTMKIKANIKRLIEGVTA